MSPSPTFSLEPTVAAPGPMFDLCLAAVRSRDPFVTTKINHGFWERLVRIEGMGYDPAALDDEAAAAVDAAIRTEAFATTGFLAEILDLVGRLPDPASGFHFAATIDAWPLSYEIEGTPLMNRGACIAMLERYVAPAQRADTAALAVTGHEFKAAFLAGTFQEFARPLAEDPFLLIANPAMASFPAFVGARDCPVIAIDATKARHDRVAILADARARLAEMPRRRVVIQAGGSLSTWLAHHLFAAFPDDLQLFDLGNAMTLCNPALASAQNWVRVYAGASFAGVERVHPGWLATDRGAGATPPPDIGASALAGLVRNPGLVALATERGVAEPDGAPPPAAPARAPGEPVAFVENKLPDLARIAAFLALSARENHHANGGPVSRLLEDAVARLVELDEGRCVVACSSATAGLFLATSLAAMRRGRRTLRWVTAASGFLSANIGPLADTVMIDCAPDGGFSLDHLRALPADSWDGVVYTNLYARHRNWARVRAFCRAAGKAFVVDNALGLLDRPPDAAGSGDVEVISCHHTKPWGTGEGGLVILDKADAADLRKLMNFAATMAPSAHPYAMNAKISDLACAAILDRIERMAHWGTFYRMQARRIRSLLEDFDVPLTPLVGQSEPRSPVSFVPLLAAGPTPEGALDNPVVVLRKYYRPLVPTPAEDGTAQAADFPNATSLYERIVCCPANPELRTVASADLAGALRRCAP